MMPETGTTRTEMPEVFLKWQCDERKGMFEALLRGEHPAFLASHLPVVSTLNGADGSFPIHSSTKGIGLFPKQEYLAEHVAEITDCLDRSRLKPAQDTRSDRVGATLSLYGRTGRIDTRCFGGIEIFQGQTFRNLQQDARAALLFTGFGPQYLSYQFNCDVEIVEAGDPRYEFLQGIRLLFDMEGFHIKQPSYPRGYVFHIREVFDKTPRQLKPGEQTQHGCPFSRSAGSESSPGATHP